MDYIGLGVLQCIDEDQMYLQGNYNTINGDVIFAKIEACHDEDYCKTPDEIREFLKGKDVMVLTNRIRFDQSLYGADAISKESLIQFIPIDTSQKRGWRLDVQTT